MEYTRVLGHTEFVKGPSWSGKERLIDQDKDPGTVKSAKEKSYLELGHILRFLDRINRESFTSFFVSKISHMALDYWDVNIIGHNDRVFTCKQNVSFSSLFSQKHALSENYERIWKID